MMKKSIANNLPNFPRSIFPKPKSFPGLNHMSKHFTHAIVHTLFAGLIAGAGMAPSNALAEDAPTVQGKTIGACRQIGGNGP
jgi:hypothetical protein